MFSTSGDYEVTHFRLRHCDDVIEVIKDGQVIDLVQETDDGWRIIPAPAWMETDRHRVRYHSLLDALCRGCKFMVPLAVVAVGKMMERRLQMAANETEEN